MGSRDRPATRIAAALRRWSIWTHRYVGIPLSPLFVLWFVSGVVMMYTGGMPELTPAARIEHRAALNLSRVRLTPAVAAERGRVPQPLARAKLLSVMGRPAYRFDGVTVFADTGDWLSPIGPSRFIGATGGGLLVLADFPPIDRAEWERATSGREVKEVSLLRIDGEAHFEVRLGRIPAAPVDRNEEDRLVVAANTLKPRRGPFDTETLVERLHAALPAIPITGAMQLDSYYYGRGVDRPPLPVIRVAEIVDGTLYTQPRPAMPHALASSYPGDELVGPFGKGRGGPGGWWIIDEPELHLDEDILVPDLAGWRRERMSDHPDAAYPADRTLEVLELREGQWVLIERWRARLDSNQRPSV